MKRSIEKMRLEYGNTPLVEEDLTDTPHELFSQWLEEAVKAQVIEPNGMVLSTVSSLGRPSSRAVLLKHFDERGFVFFTNLESRKALQLVAAPFASLTFWWREIYRQVTVEGHVELLSRKDNQSYFTKRPRGAQLAAHASHQSAPLASRYEIEEVFERLKKKYRGKNIPCPSDWGGYRVIPNRIEFWQGRANRLHDRFLYVLTDTGWVISRLSP